MSIRKMLNVPKGYKITRLQTKEDTKELHVEIEPYKRSKAKCSFCGQIHTKNPRGTKIVVARDLPVSEWSVYLHVKKRRYLCPKDDKLHVEEVDWLKKKAELPIDFLKKFID